MNYKSDVEFMISRIKHNGKILKALRMKATDILKDYAKKHNIPIHHVSDYSYLDRRVEGMMFSYNNKNGYVNLVSVEFEYTVDEKGFFHWDETKPVINDS